MATRPALGLISTLRGLEALGEDPTPVLERYGLDLAQLEPGARIDRTLMLHIYIEVAGRLQNPSAGVRIGPCMSFAAYGPLTMLLMTSAGARSAIGDGIRYQNLSYLFSALGFEPGARASALTLRPPALDPAGLRFLIDTELSGTLKLINDLQATIGTHERPEAIDLPYPRPADAHAYEPLFGCRVRFDEPVARLWISNEFLQMTFPTADPHAHAMYQAQCDRQLTAALDELDSLPDRIREYLRLFRGRLPDAGQIGRYFGLPERSLRRQLGETGTSLRALVGEVRCDKACQLLHDTPLSIEAIADQLGYAEPAAFIHAFRRWQRMTPGAYRRASREHTATPHPPRAR